MTSWVNLVSKEKDMKEEALKLADELDLIAGMIAIGDRIKWGQDSELMENGSAMIRRLVEELDKQGEPVAWMELYYGEPNNLAWTDAELRDSGEIYKTVPLYTSLVFCTAPQTKPLNDEELNKAFDYYCETDEGVLRFNYELRDEWKKEQLIRWKEAFKKASER